jgi:hypothetical protein
MQENFRSFLQELEEPSCGGSSGKELLEVEVLGIMRKEGFSDEQIYGMPLKKLLDLFYDAYLWKANNILSRSAIEVFLKKLQRNLV